MCTCAWDNALARQLFGFFSFSLRVLFAILNLNLVDMQSYSGRHGCVHTPERSIGIKAEACFSFPCIRTDPTASADLASAGQDSGLPVRLNQSGNVRRMHTFAGAPSPPRSEPFVERNIKRLLGGHVHALGGTQTQ